jgi:hypothetical protein
VKNGRSPAPEPLMTVYDAKLQCRGFVLNRGRNGFEAFNSDVQSLGSFPNKEAAVAAVHEGTA